jgi:methylglutaconyl-CoA hydratase
MSWQTLEIESDGFVRRVWLSRPDVHNALNTDMIAELTRAFTELGQDAAARVIVLGGRGKSFCGGADIGMMKAAGAMTPSENRAEARKLSAMFRTINECPKPVIGRIHGAALGGGAGLTACVDVALTEAGCKFGFTEAKLGIMPAVISPFTVAKIGYSAARAHFTTGGRFDAHEAARIALVHHVAADTAALDAEVARWIGEYRSAAPGSVAAIKDLLQRLARPSGLDSPEVAEMTAELIAGRRASDEGKEGLAAFLERRKPVWTEGE